MPPRTKATATTPATAPEPVTHESLEEALAAFQAEMPVVPKNHTATIRGKDGQTGYSYSYADLADVSEAAMPLLTRHGLAFVCVPRLTQAGGYELSGRLSHSSRVGGDADGVLTGALPVVGRDAQAIGSSLTYGRRYLLGSMTGVVTDDDDDGQHAAAAKDQQTRTEPAQNDPNVYAPNGQPWRMPDGSANPDALEPHQRSVWDSIARLTSDESGQYQSWHQAQGLPGMSKMDEFHAQTALSFLEELVSKRPPA